MANSIFDINLMDTLTGRGASATGGVCQVCINGTARKATLTDPAAGFAALANPVTISNGRIRFAVATGSPGQASPGLVDIYGITGAGHFFALTGVKPGSPTEIYVDQARSRQRAIIPFSVADCTPGTEKDTGFVLPSGCLVHPWPLVSVTVAAGQGSKTVNLGLLSTQSGGDADGFVAGVSLTSIAKVKATINGASAPLGALLTAVQGAGSQVVPEAALIGATAINVSYTITSAATLAEGFVILEYELTATPTMTP